jgi:hypothetical protein
VLLKTIIPLGGLLIALICGVLNRGNNNPLLVLSSSNTVFGFTEAALSPILTCAGRAKESVLLIINNSNGFIINMVIHESILPRRRKQSPVWESRRVSASG